MKKIVITGCLGYVGWELCKLYSGETRYKNIVVTDNKFLSEKVNQLTDWGFTFIQNDILNKEELKHIVEDADVVYHLAGVTDVAYTKSESNDAKDQQLIQIAIEGTRNIVDLIPDKCRLIFASTHVVFEGYETTTFDITEDAELKPVLAYSRSKAQNEIDIKNSNKNYVILRFGSVYGYSEDTMRINIMPNLFSKMASQNKTIKLFGGGVQYKSLVSVIDVARCLKFVSLLPSANKQTYHLSNENLTVKEVAEIVKKYSPNTSIIETDDEIPNKGYTLSNKKLLSTGFYFLYNIDKSIKEMVERWSEKQQNKLLEYTIRGEKDYIDERGRITNYSLTEPINLIGWIESKAGTVRANHFHPIQEQKCLLISGRYISVIKDLADPKAQIKTQIINPGDIAIIKPNVAHTMVFLEDSLFLNLVRGEREHENYGITHTMPYRLVDENFKEELLQNYARNCRVSDSKNLKPVLSLGMSPLANNLLNSMDDKDELFPLELTYCPESHNCQLSYIVPPNKMFDNYLYASSTAKSFRDHFAKAAEQYQAEFNLNKNSLVIDIGSNDGIALLPLKEKGIKTLGVEPAKNIAKIARKNGIETINNYFTNKIARQIVKKYGSADIITASNVFAHADGLREIAQAAFSALKPDGCFIIEVQYLLDTIKDLTFDNIYHEHVNYWSVTSLKNFFDKLQLNIVKVEHVNTHGGSIRVYVKRTTSVPDKSVEQFLQEEQNFGLTDYQTYLNFAKRVEQAKTNVIKNIENFKKQGLQIVGYGSPAKATTALNYYGITNKDIDYIVEDSPLKYNKILPGIKIPIYSKEKLNDKLPDIIIVMAWNFFEDIVRNNQDLIDKGVNFISIKDLQYDAVKFTNI